MKKKNVEIMQAKYLHDCQLKMVTVDSMGTLFFNLIVADKGMMVMYINTHLLERGTKDQL
jgi:hypothetical protein